MLDGGAVGVKSLRELTSNGKVRKLCGSRVDFEAGQSRPVQASGAARLAGRKARASTEAVASEMADALRTKWPFWIQPDRTAGFAPELSESRRASFGEGAARYFDATRRVIARNSDYLVLASDSGLSHSVQRCVPMRSALKPSDSRVEHASRSTICNDVVTTSPALRDSCDPSSRGGLGVASSRRDRARNGESA